MLIELVFAAQVLSLSPMPANEFPAIKTVQVITNLISCKPNGDFSAAASLAPPSEPLRKQLQSAIWADLQLNGMIGNGNWLASLWYNVGNYTVSDLHIVALRCLQERSKQRCAFELVRDAGPTTVLGEPAPDKLTCVALFARINEGWSVVHTAPRKAGHSQTSMRCKAQTF